MSANLSGLAAAQTLVALDVINNEKPVGLTPTARREQLADQARIKYTDRVTLHRSATPLEFADLAGNGALARKRAAEQLQSIASHYGITASELVSAVREHVRVSADLAPATIKIELSSDIRKPMQWKGPLTFDGNGVAALTKINEMVGSWKFKAGVAKMMELAQYRAMIGEHPRGANSAHIQLAGPPGVGKSMVLELLAPICFNLRLITCNKAHVISASKILGMNSGQTEKNLTYEYSEGVGMDCLVALDEIGGLGNAEKAEALYPALAAKLTQSLYHRTLTAISGYPSAVRKFIDKDAGFERRFGSVLELTRFTADELTHLFLRESASKGYVIDPATFAEARKYFNRMAITANTGSAGFVHNAMGKWAENVASRCLDDLTAGRVTVDQAKVWAPADIKPVKGAYAPLAAFPDDVTVEQVVDHLEKDVWGQRHVLEEVAEALVTRRRMNARTDQTEKPIGRHLFAGPSSAGKSLLTKAIARTFMTAEDLADGREPPIYKLDMQTIKSLQTWLGGAQAGYIGFEKECPLVEWMKQNPGGVIELAEMDKGPDDAMDVLMEIFDTGKFTTQAGNELDFSNYVLVGTGNYGNEVSLHKRKKVDRKMAESGKTEPGQVFALGALVTDKGVPVGGGMMTISADFQPGSGRLEIIGNSKKVMDESSKIAYGYVRKNGERYGIAKDALSVLDKRDLTIHYEPAAVEKDGPSAGITMATAIVSALRGQIVPPNIAMTGEIGARGKVGPVGGIREKLFAAVQNGCDTFILSEENRKDTVGLPEGMRDRIRLIFVEHFDEVVAAVYDPKNGKKVTDQPIPDGTEREVIEARTHEYLTRKLRSEQLGRLSNGKAVVFQMHTEERMREIVRGRLRSEADKQLAHLPIELDVDNSALDFMMKYWNDDTGPRPIIDALNAKIVSPLVYEQAKEPNRLPADSAVLASYVNGKMEFSVVSSLLPSVDPALIWVDAAAANPAVVYTPAPKQSLFSTWNLSFGQARAKGTN